MSLLAPQQFLQIRMHGSEMDSTRFSYTACYTVPEHLCAIKDPVRRVVVLVTEFSAYTV